MVLAEVFRTGNRLLCENNALGKLTSLSPYRQVFILLDIQHQLQAVAHSTLHCHHQGSSILARIEGVALSVARENLKHTKIQIQGF